MWVKMVSMEPTEEVNSNLRKDFTRFIEMKYKKNDGCIPDFAFIGNYYVQYIFKKRMTLYTIVE